MIFVRRALLLATCVAVAGAAHQAHGQEVYSLFGKLFLSGRVEYDFTQRRDFLTDIEDHHVQQNEFDFDRIFRRGFHSVMIIEEQAGATKNILSLGEVPTTFTRLSFDQVDMTGARWDVRGKRTDWSAIMVPGSLNPVIGQEHITGSGVGLRQVTKTPRAKYGAAWYFRETPVLSLDVEASFTNIGRKAEIAITPKGAVTHDLRGRADASAAVYKEFHTIGDTIVQLEAFRVGPHFDASRSVGDNDDQDRYTDNTPLDPPSKIIPGDLDKNDNGVFDYEDDVLLFDVDEDFLDEGDRNNNGVRDQEENDKDPNYEFDAARRGLRLWLTRRKSTRDTATDVDLGVRYETTLGDEDVTPHATATKLFSNIEHRRTVGKASVLQLDNELKYVRDAIPDETWHFAARLSPAEAAAYRALPKTAALEAAGEIGFLEFEGVTEVERRRRDPISMQNDIINTTKLTWEYSGIRQFVATARAKLQYDLDIDGEDEQYEVGILKARYTFRPSKKLEVSPMLKYTVRDGFRRDEARLEDVAVAALVTGDDGIEVPSGVERVRLRRIDETDVRDMATAVILRVENQFTPTIRLTGGVQLLLFDDLLEDDNDFIRQAVLAEMEKSFQAYNRDMFLHIGARYIDQRARGDLNDANFMETFVRVFAKF
jgi:hypothetical protein